MYQVTIPESKNIILESVFELNATVESKLRKDFGTSEGMIESFKNKKNRVAISQPYLENLISSMQDKGEEISHGMRRLIDKYDFHFVALNCVFQPEIDCKFEWARVGLDLSAVNSKTRKPVSVSSPPITYSLFPENVLSEIKVKRGFGVTPELKFKILEEPLSLEAGMSGHVDKSEEYILYEPEITSYGLNTSKVAWDFKSTKERSVLGDRKLHLVIQTPKDTKVKGKFLLGAEVSSSVSKWLPIPVSKRKHNAVEAHYDLSE
ncbi:MAG TPA: hypothetical protein VKA09_02270 [Nitrososphaeraceae archaeon]|nr:hypothetical protein [Nitrososphaeraceae archaeon]